MTKTTRYVIPGERRETRNPEAKNWTPACAGMTERLVFTFPLSAQRYGGLAMLNTLVFLFSKTVIAHAVGSLRLEELLP